MNAAERAAALVAGQPAECPRCDTTLDVLTDRYGRAVHCPSCHYRSSFAMACVIGKHGDETAAIWLEEKWGREGPADLSLVPDPESGPEVAS